MILGKTNVPFMLQDWQSYNELYGTTGNPWDLGRTAGGSSGGSAAALAAGFGALSIGSDLTGSLRNPAHFCGVYAHKPTFGVVATRGMAPPPAPALPVEGDLGVCGPMARTARDLALLLDALAGPDPLTLGAAYDLTLPPARHQRLGDFRVLVLEEHPLLATGSAVRAGVRRVADALADGGARVERQSPLLPDLAEAATLYLQLAGAGPLDGQATGAGRGAHRRGPARAARAAAPGSPALDELPHRQEAPGADEEQCGDGDEEPVYNLISRHASTIARSQLSHIR